MTSLVTACLIALVAVFILLGLLAMAMNLITRAFPVRDDIADTAVVAAVAAAVAALIPGARVTRIEEES